MTEKVYYIELTKKIVVPMAAESRSEALLLATDEQEGFDGAWDRAETAAEILWEEEDLT